MHIFIFLFHRCFTSYLTYKPAVEGKRAKENPWPSKGCYPTFPLTSGAEADMSGNLCRSDRIDEIQLPLHCSGALTNVFEWLSASGWVRGLGCVFIIHTVKPLNYHIEIVTACHACNAPPINLLVSCLQYEDRTPHIGDWTDMSCRSGYIAYKSAVFYCCYSGFWDHLNVAEIAGHLIR